MYSCILRGALGSIGEDDDEEILFEQIHVTLNIQL